MARYKGKRNAIANLVEKANTITGKPSEPSARPKPDLEIATKSTVKTLTGINISNLILNYLKYVQTKFISFKIIFNLKLIMI